MAAAKRKKLDDEKPELPRQPQVGDRIRLKEKRIPAYDTASKLAGYDFDLHAIRIVIREDNYNPGGGRRLFVEGQPHCFASTDVELAWNTEDERRAELQRQGWRV
jgi:hypothetical protein